jgi:hypothetical protein
VSVRSFVLVDLVSQADYIPHEVRAWPRERILTWLAQYGEVWPIPTCLNDGNHFGFRSGIGREAICRLTNGGEMTLIGNHFMIPVWEKPQ